MRRSCEECQVSWPPPFHERAISKGEFNKLVETLSMHGIDNWNKNWVLFFLVTTLHQL